MRNRYGAKSAKTKTQPQSTASKTKEKGMFGMEQKERLTQRTGQKNPSAILNPPNKNPSSASPSSASRSFVAMRADSQIRSIRTISAAAPSVTGTLPVYLATKFVWKVLLSTGKPECIMAATLRARARSRRSRGQRGRDGFDSARNSQMARESVIVEGREWHFRIGTSPVGETVFIYGLCEFLCRVCW